MVVHVGLSFARYFLSSLSSNCEDLWGHIVFQMFLTIGAQPLWMYVFLSDLLLTCFVTWVIVTWVTLGRLTYHWFMALCANLDLLFGSSLAYDRRQDVGYFSVFATRVISIYGRGTLWK